MKIVTFETAKLAKEKGFNEPCRRHYSINGVINSSKQPITHKSLRSGGCLAPYQYVLMDWLREKHNIYILIKPASNNKWIFILVYLNNLSITSAMIYIDDYYECLEIALQTALK